MKRRPTWGVRTSHGNQRNAGPHLQFHLMLPYIQGTMPAGDNPFLHHPSRRTPHSSDAPNGSY
jgi:hypothetical protein